MSEVVVRFTVPDDVRSIFDHELDLVMDSMEPMLAWLRQNGGRFVVSVTAANG